MKKKENQNWEEAFRTAIEQSGLSLYEISKQSGIDQSQLSRFMRQQRGLSIKTAEQLAAIVGLRLERKKR
ncbi:MAG: helix-turn-helix domain-containing protein [Planctomycetaceae bacterium]|nr:helix-turn-helix domain-containing protein [Planctomycetaceae bacterium]